MVGGAAVRALGRRPSPCPTLPTLRCSVSSSQHSTGGASGRQASPPLCLPPSPLTETEKPMDFTEPQQEILTNAWLLSRGGNGQVNGQVITAEAYPHAHELAEAGWLERRFEPDGETSWWWTPQAETALDMNALLTGHSPN